MAEIESDQSRDELVTRRAVRSIKRFAPYTIGAALLAGLVVFFTQQVDSPTFTSEGAVELTDDVASGINASRSRRDAQVEIQARIVGLESDAFVALVRSGAEIGDRSAEVLAVRASNAEDTAVILIEVEATTSPGAQLGVDAAIASFVVQRTVQVTESLDRELAPLRAQRVEQIEAIDTLRVELEEKIGIASTTEISILESRTAAALSRLAEYDRAIQEREFLIDSSTGELRVIRTATSPSLSSPNELSRPIQVSAFVLVVLLIGSVTVDRLRGTLQLLDEIRSAGGPDIPVLATVPKFRSSLRKGSSALVVGRRNTRREAEAFRYLRTAVEVATEGATPLVIAFTSAGPNEGKTVTSSNFALATARAERTTALLDGDLLNSSTGELFQAHGANAFVGLLNGTIDPTTEEFFRIQTNGAPLDVLASRNLGRSSGRQELPTRP